MLAKHIIGIFHGGQNFGIFWFNGMTTFLPVVWNVHVTIMIASLATYSSPKKTSFFPEIGIIHKMIIGLHS